MLAIQQSRKYGREKIGDMSCKGILFNQEMVKAILDGRKTVTRRLVKPQPQGYFEVNENPLFIYDTEWNQGRIHPSCQVGDILYVRETFLKADDGYHYKADNKVPSESETIRNAYGYKWKPSIHMPKEAARIFLRVTDVRVERLQDITWQQAAKEGCQGSTSDEPDELFHLPTLRGEFEKLWDSTIDMKEHWMDQSWGANPFCWVIEFERIDKVEAMQ